MNEQFRALYERGIAVGYSDIKNDTLLFQYGDEKFEFPTSKVYHLTFWPHCEWTGYFYSVPIEKLRELKQELEKNP